jgi:hypothetical protein
MSSHCVMCTQLYFNILFRLSSFEACIYKEDRVKGHIKRVCLKEKCVSTVVKEIKLEL